MTGSKANQLFTLVQDFFLNKYKNEPGLQYLAIVKSSKKFDYFFEIGFKEEELTVNRFKEIKNDIKKNFPNEPQIFSDFKINSKKKKLLSQTIKKLKVTYSKNISDFEFHKKTIFGTQIRSPETSLEKGTLGAILELYYEDDKFLITNHHVIELINDDDGIYNEEGKKIGVFFRGFSCAEYDVAFGKLTTDHTMSGIPEFKLGKLKQPSFSIKNIMGKGMRSGHHQKGLLYSTRAIVKIKNRWFKEQILFKNLGFNHGDSGSIIVERNNNDKKDVIGLYIGSNSVIYVANNLYNLLSKPIPPTDNKPAIKFKSFIN